jgi:hypothetical protein
MYRSEQPPRCAARIETDWEACVIEIEASLLERLSATSVVALREAGAAVIVAGASSVELRAHARPGEPEILLAYVHYPNAGRRVVGTSYQWGHELEEQVPELVRELLATATPEGRATYRVYAGGGDSGQEQGMEG